MLTDDRLPRELSAAFHSAADPVARLISPPDALLRQATRYRRRRTAIRAGGLTAAAAVAAIVAPAAGTIVGGIVQLSAQTGKPLQTLLAQRAVPSAMAPETVTSCQLNSVDPTGEHLLVSCVPDKFGRLDRGRFTALPVAGTVGVYAAAW